MTVSTTTTRDQFTGTGANTALSTTFAFDESSEVVVTSRVIATGVETTLTETTHYTVTGGSGSTGTVTPEDGDTDFPSTVEWTLERQTPITQATDYVENDDFSAESHEDALDKLTFIAQERSDKADRALRAPTTDDADLDMELPNAVDRASLFLAFDADGEPIASAGVTPATVTVSAYGETLIDDADADAARVTLDAQEAVITAQGDLVVGDSTPEASVLAIGAADTVLTSDGTDPGWTAPADLDTALPRSYLAGLTLSNDTDTAKDIAIAVGACRDSTNTVNMILSAAMGKMIDATWEAGGVPGTTVGGLNATDVLAGAPEASEMYHVFIIAHTDGTVDAGFDKLVNAASLLSDSGYTYYRRIGTIFTDATPDILGFTQEGDTFLWDSPPEDVDDATFDDNDENFTLSVAPYAWCQLNVLMSVGALAYLRSTIQDDENPVNNAAPLYTVNGGVLDYISLKADASSQIRGVTDAQADETLKIVTVSYVDRRGRDD